MTESNNLKGIAWDVFTTNFGRGVAIQRLDFIRDATGRPTYPNDIFATDLAAREFVEVMAEHGDEECRLALAQIKDSEAELVDYAESFYDGY